MGQFFEFCSFFFCYRFFLIDQSLLVCWSELKRYKIEEKGIFYGEVDLYLILYIFVLKIINIRIWEGFFELLYNFMIDIGKYCVIGVFMKI